MSQYTLALDDALGYLESVQDEDGGFATFASTKQFNFSDALQQQTTFVPIIILGALADVDMPQAKRICAKLSRYILEQRSQAWSFNYWAKKAPERASEPYPDDLDDTFCALLALHVYDKTLVDASVLAQAVKMLIATEQKPGGPYRTWVVSKDSDAAWLDVDYAVNANIAGFLCAIGSPLPSLHGFLTHRFPSLQSPYYPSEYPLLYYLARVDDPRLKQRVRGKLENLKLDDGSWGTPQQTALAACALDDAPSQALDFLLNSQQPDGSWPSEAFCIYRDQKERIYHGASALTTALAARALWRSQTQTESAGEKKKQTDSKAQKFYEHAVNELQAELSVLEDDLARRATTFTMEMLNYDKKHEIALLSYYFWRSLQAPPDMSCKTQVSLSLANTYGWVAYTIYDDFLDEEGDIGQLSVANVALRSSLLSFQRAVDDKAFQQLVIDTFNIIDAANTWEVANCRFVSTKHDIVIGPLPDYGDRMRLAERSLGHTLTPIAVLVCAGVDAKGAEIQSLSRALKHYLIARQLSDDLHDWEEDVRAGHISYVVAAIMDDMKLQPWKYDFAEILPHMTRQFWHHTLPRLCDVVEGHLQSSREALPENLKQNGMLEKLLVGIEAIIQETRTKQAEAKEFLDSYQSP